MSRTIATRAIRGARALVDEARAQVEAAIAELGADKPVAFTNTAYYLPVIYAFTGRKVETLGDLPAVLERAGELLHPVPSDSMWLPYLGETLDSGVATLFAEEVIEGVRFARGAEPQIVQFGRGENKERFGTGDLVLHGDKMKLNGPIDDVQLRAWGIQLVDGRMPGFARSSARQDQRRGRQDRARAAEPQHPDLPVWQRQWAQHHRPAASKRASSWATTPTSCPSASTPSRPSTRSASRHGRP